MLEGFGFHMAFVKWIKEMLKTSSFSIAINRSTEGFFMGKRGIRQGDPISSFLFTVVMEVFFMLLNRCIRDMSNFGYHNGCKDLDITHLCFVDDLLVLIR